MNIFDLEQTMKRLASEVPDASEIVSAFFVDTQTRERIRRKCKPPNNPGIPTPSFTTHDAVGGIKVFAIDD